MVRQKVLLTEAQRGTLRSICEAILPSLSDDETRQVVEFDRRLHEKGGLAYDQSRIRTVADFCKRSANDLDVAGCMETTISKHMREESQRELGLLLRVLGTSVGTLLLCGRFCPFHELSLEGRQAALNVLQESVITQKRKIFASLKKGAALKFLSVVPSDLGINPNWAALRFPAPMPPVEAAQEAEARGMNEFVYSMINQDVSEGAVLDVDVVIVGSGCGGSVMAAELSKENKVLVVEKGKYIRRCEMDGTEDFAYEALYESGGALTTEDTGMTVLAGAAFGGGSAVNWACSIRLPNYVREEWAEVHGLQRFGPESAAFSAAIETVCTRIGVQKGDQVTHNKNNALFIDGCKACGYDVDITGQNMKSVASDAMEAGGVSLGNRCGIKNSTPETWLQDAARNGCLFADQCKIEKVLHSHGKATGVSGTMVSNGTSVRVTVHARKAVVVSAGSINTPALLLRSGLPNKNGLIGRNLRLHPVCGVVADMPGPVETWQGAPMTTVSEAGAAGTDGSHYGFKLECPCLHIGLGGCGRPWASGVQFREELLRQANAMVTIVLCRDKGSGEVRIDKNGDPKLYYPLASHDREQLLLGSEMLTRISCAAGAERISSSCNIPDGFCELPLLAGVDASEQEQLEARVARNAALEDYILKTREAGIKDFKSAIFSAHQMGTAKMSVAPQTGVCKDTGEVWEVQGLYVADASVFPTPSGANPHITTMALAYDMATRLREALRYGEVSAPLRSRL